MDGNDQFKSNFQNNNNQMKKNDFGLDSDSSLELEELNPVT